MTTEWAVATLAVLRWLTLFPLALFGLVLLGAWLGHRSLERTAGALARRDCPRCGTPLGKGAVATGQTAWQEEFRRLAEAHPGVRLRVVAHWPLRCPVCGANFRFRVSDDQLLPA